ncbi:hypothetical protein Clst_1590 [Thermoclostridium stercorarium subsp. stercorarium DSM 8532]|jgi:hypothetical protein|nr:hypothetical protein Clst_1590 [Thermoclostridium stercorarium subsp. stercorarium DSM 8532]
MTFVFSREKMRSLNGIYSKTREDTTVVLSLTKK